jgi:hypothetical protein
VFPRILCVKLFWFANVRGSKSKQRLRISLRCVEDLAQRLRHARVRHAHGHLVAQLVEGILDCPQLLGQAVLFEKRRVRKCLDEHREHASAQLDAFQRAQRRASPLVKGS